VEQNRVTFNKRAYIYSSFFHGALIVLMLNIPLIFNIEVPVFYELHLGSVSQQRMEQILEESRRSEAIRRLEKLGMSPGERVEVPERKMIEIEEPTISVPNEQRIRTDDIITNAEKQTFEVVAPDFDIPITNRSIFSMDRKENFQGSRITIGEQPGTGIETSTIGADLVGVTIEGEIKGREIISNPLPEYPQGLNQNAIIKIQLVVLPDGTVSSSDMVPVRKENAVLEELSMNTLKLWRFSSLPAGDKRNQTGVITFNFKVK